MNEFKGTKGKWEKSHLNDDSGLHAIFSAKNNTLVARTCYLPLSDYNAQLIACAPEMLEMLKRCEIWISKCNQYSPFAKEIQELIKKSTKI